MINHMKRWASELSYSLTHERHDAQNLPSAFIAISFSLLPLTKNYKYRFMFKNSIRKLVSIKGDFLYLFFSLPKESQMGNNNDDDNDDASPSKNKIKKK